MKYDDCLKFRSLAIENTSYIPIIIKWHLFRIENDSFIEIKPLKLFLHIFTPYSFFENSKNECNEEKLKFETPFIKSSLERYESNPSFKELNRFNSLTLTDR